MKKRGMKRRVTPFDALNAIFVGLITLLCIYPFYYILIYSISDANLASRGLFLLPKGFSLDTYIGIFSLNDIPQALLISVARTIAATGVTLVCSSFFAFLASKQEMLFHKFVYRFVVITMYFNAGLIPWYLTMRLYGLKNSFLLYIVPGAVVAYYVVLIKTYIESMPKELEESAKIDGAGVFTVFARIIVPLSKPIIATIAVYSMVGQWNSWTDNYFLVSDENLQTLQMVLYNYLKQSNRMKQMASSNIGDASALVSSITTTSVKMCITMVAVIPILFVYPFLQRYFLKGIMMGAVKG